MTYVGMLAGHVICVSIVLVAVFFKRRWLKPVAVVAGAVALWLPLMAHLNSLGAASPFKPKNEFRVISSKVDEENQRLYLFVDLLGKDYTPRVFRIPFDPSKWVGLRGNPAYLENQVMRFEAGRGGEFEAVYIDYVPPDLLKDGVMRGWQAPRPDD